MPKTILHIIESLAIGGAEVLLVESLKGFSAEYRHVVVYMRLPETLLQEIKEYKTYFLDYKGKRNILMCIYRLHKIIKKERADLVHAHHYWPTIVARFATPKRIPLLFTVHNPLSFDAFRLNKLSLYLEKITYQKHQHPLFISKAVMYDYDNYIGIRGKASILYNFVADAFFEEAYHKKKYYSAKLRLIAVGTLKQQKNYTYLINVLKLLKEYPVHLDIFGEGPYREQIEAEIKEHKLDKVVLKGAEREIYKLLPGYDAFIQASTYEGFGIAMVEAMAVGLPCILSDIEAHQEVAGEAALFFDFSSPSDCADKIQIILQNIAMTQKLGEVGREKATLYTRDRYIAKLKRLYSSYLVQI